MENEHTARYFAAANSRRGFVSFFDEVFGGLGRVFIIKGGPGTGKSSIMKRIGAEAEKKGREVEYYYCSSDPNSLDGVVIPSLSCGIVDGTAPHTRDPRYPQVCEELVDVGRFWDRELLLPHSFEIRDLIDKISGCYNQAYGYLGAAGELCDISESLIKGFVLHDKMNAAVGRIMRSCGSGAAYSAEVRMTRAICGGGGAYLDSFERQAERIYSIDDRFGIAHLLLEKISEETVKRGLSVKIAYSPLDTKHIEALFIEDKKLAFVPIEYSGFNPDKDAENIKIINTARFIDRDGARSIKPALRRCRKELSALLSCAQTSLDEARSLHDRLEKYYISSMDFKSESKYTDELCKRIFG